MRDPRRGGRGRGSPREGSYVSARRNSYRPAPASSSTPPTVPPRGPRYEEQWQETDRYRTPLERDVQNQKLVIDPSEEVFSVVLAITQLQQQKDEEISRLKHECEHLEGSLVKSDQENAWLHRRAKQIQEELDDKVADKLGEVHEKHGKRVLTLEAKAESLQNQIKIRDRIIRGMNNHMIMRGVPEGRPIENKQSLKRRASGAGVGFDDDACPHVKHRRSRSP